MCSVRDRLCVLILTGMLLPLAVCSVTRKYRIPVTVCSLCKGTCSLFAELEPLFEGRLIIEGCVLLLGCSESASSCHICLRTWKFFETGNCLQSPCYKRDFERMALFTVSLILLYTEMWPRLALPLPSPNLCFHWGITAQLFPVTVCIVCQVLLASLSCTGTRLRSLRILHLKPRP